MTLAERIDRQERLAGTRGFNVPSIEVDRQELVQLAALDSPLFVEVFFSKTARQRSPAIHTQVWEYLEDPRIRFLNLRMFRGSAKTTLLRMFMAKRVAYGLSNTIFYLGATEPDAIHSIQWLRNAVDKNALFSQTFGLGRGAKWQETECQILRAGSEQPCWITASGVNGSVRGVNFDDYRPDLIILDDILTDESASSPEQRGKMSNLIHGAIRHSLAPRSEDENAKMVFLNTPINSEDAGAEAEKDPEWRTINFPCWTNATKDLPVENQESAWPERHPSEELRDEKRAALAKNKYSLFAREMECRLVTAETSSFRAEWLKYREPNDQLPMLGLKVLVIDPVPPPTEAAMKKGLGDRDYEVMAVMSRYGGKYHLLEYSQHRGHDPSWTIAEFFRLADKYRVYKVVVETVAYQAVLAWLLKEAMARQRKWYAIQEWNKGRQNKRVYIVNAINGIASNGALTVLPTHSEFISQFTAYPNVPHDDVIEAVAIGLQELSSPLLDLTSGEYSVAADEGDYEDLNLVGGCP